ncbi:MAG: response regulator [Clostridiaceae bacterium]|nr:response regulator [Clostridiaceae bacterium]
MSRSMLRVMLVDDEENERNLLKLCINWNEFEMEIAGEASSGREALDLLEDINPDIIITDIRMPFMDGLEFSRIVAETYPYIKVMVLTAHEEFEYAKEGIKVGVSDFLLKPIKRADLKAALVNLKNKIEAERLHKNEFEELRKQLEESFPYIKEKFLNELLQNNLSDEEIKSKLDYFSIKGFESYVQLVLIEPCHSELDIAEETRVLLGMKCTEIVRQYFKEDTGIEVFVDNSHRIVVLSGGPEVDIVECCEQIKAMIINRLKCYVNIGIGNVHRNLKEIKQSYREASEALNYKVIYGKNHIISFDENKINESTWNMKMDELNEIGFHVKTGLEDKALEMINGIFDGFYSQGLKSIDFVRITSINIITVILNSITELGLDFNDVFEGGKLPYDRVFIIDNLPDMKGYMLNMVKHAISSVKNMRTRKTNKVINEIIEYMKENLSEQELSLAGVAKQFYLNSSYLSRAFKQETGRTFVEFMTGIRIEKALKLFKETDLMLYEVAQEIGIPDPNYFGKCFKKYVGMSVNEYRKQG